MDYELNQLSDIDVFFYYGEKGSDLNLETQSDILCGLLQPKRSFFYDRTNSSGTVEKENMPNGSMLAILTRYDIVNWIAYRNTQVTDGSNGYPDRRVAASQNSINIEINEKGLLDVNVGYIPFSSFKQAKSVNIPISRGV